MNDKTILGLTGPFGSGASYIAKEFLVGCGYEYLSLSQMLRNAILENDPGCSPEDLQSRVFLQDKGDKLRKEKSCDVLAKMALDIIKSSPKKKWIIDSIRNTKEVSALQKAGGSFFLLAIQADSGVRWDRVKAKYSDDQGKFNRDEKRDRDGDIDNGQQVAECYRLSDIVILNNKKLAPKSEDYNKLKLIVKNYTDMIERTTAYEPSEQETLMTVAYATSMRSSCMKRKVGAIIIDDYGNVISSGFNEVPVALRSCKHEHGDCHRDLQKREFALHIEGIVKDVDMREAINSAFKRQFKVLDYCRALHAEENAILNMARLGTSRSSKNSLYTTTYPCSLCANKIAQMGISQIIYFEPYPMEDAKNILRTRGVNEIPFSGVTYNGYFRLMGVVS